MYQCTRIRDSQNYAVKMVTKGLINGPDLMREIEFLYQLEHTNIVRTVDIMEDEQNIYIVHELLCGGELFDHIVDSDTISERDASHIIQQLLSALAYLHEKDIVHRDIKPENIMVDTKGYIKLIDMGTATFLKDR